MKLFFLLKTYLVFLITCILYAKMGAGSCKVYDGENDLPHVIKFREKKGVSTCENIVNKSATLKVKRK